MVLRRLPLILFFIFLAGLSVWLMWHTFSYDSSNRSVLISAKAWSDFSWMLPLSRSFSLGHNWPPQNPFYPGLPLKYHFLFYLITGTLERSGIRIDLAFNLLSGSGFFLLVFMIWALASRLFNRSSVGVISVVLFLLNGSLSFIDYFSKHGWSPAALTNILHNPQYPSFGPWDGSQIAAIWNLNIYTNQRPLALALGLLLLLVYLLNFSKNIHPLVIGILVSILIYLDQGILPGLAVILGIYFLLVPRLRLPLFLAGIFTLPWAIISLNFLNPSFFRLHPGFLTPPPLSVPRLLGYWFANLGLSLVFIPVGFILAPRQAKILVPSLLIIFLLPNLFQFSPDIFNNHKLLNLFIIFADMFTAFVIVKLWGKRFLKAIVPILLFFLTFSGLIDFFALKNDYLIPVADIPVNSDASFIYHNLPPQSVTLNSTWLYHPASLAGRYIFSGYSYFTWAHGYDSFSRESIQKSIYASPDKATACLLLLQNNIDYVDLNDHPEGFLQPNYSLWRKSFYLLYSNPQTGFYLYDVQKSCQT